VRVWEGHRHSFLAINLFLKNDCQIFLRIFSDIIVGCCHALQR
jgi:hypothetical protein